jgi:glycosyltransferase involved in cell wall biosynthesis
MSESDGLLFFAGPMSSRYRAGKIYEYIAAGPRIIVFGDHGEVSELIERLQAGILVRENDADAFETAINYFLENRSNWKRHPKTEAWLQRHTRQVLADEFFDIIELL